MATHPKNIVPFSFDPNAVDFSQFDEQLNALPLTEPGPLEAERVGFVPASGIVGEPLSVQVDRFLAFAVGIKTKIVPGSVIAERLKVKVQELTAQGRPVGGKMRRELRNAIRDDLLRQAFCKTTTVRCWIDRRGWLFVDTSSRNMADVCLSRLREAMGSFPAVPPRAATAKAAFRAWVRQNGAPAPFDLGDSCVLSIPASGATWTGKKINLCGKEVAEHLDAAAEFDRIGLQFAERLAFTLDANCIVRQLKSVSEDTASGAEDGSNEEMTPAMALAANVLLVASDAAELFNAIDARLVNPLEEAA